jgi:hypothetical protein
MTYIGRLTLLISVINSLPMYAMRSLKVPIIIYVHFQKKATYNSYGMIKKIKFRVNAFLDGKWYVDQKIKRV